MEPNISTIIGRTLSIGIGLSNYMEVHYQICTISLQTHQGILYLREIFQSMHSRFLDALDHLWNHPASFDDIATTTLKTPTSDVYFIRGCLGEYSHSAIEKIKKDLHILQPNQTLKSRQIHLCRHTCDTYSVPIIITPFNV